MPDFHLHVAFNNGEEKTYDTRPLIKEREAFQTFELTYKLFEQVKVDGGGYGVYWKKITNLHYINLQGFLA